MSAGLSVMIGVFLRIKEPIIGECDDETPSRYAAILPGMHARRKWESVPPVAHSAWWEKWDAQPARY